MSFNAKDMTQGGQIAFMRFRMFGQIANIILYCLVLLFSITIAITLMFRISWQTFINGIIYWWCRTLGPMREIAKTQPVYHIQYYGKKLTYNAEQILKEPYAIWCGEQLWSSFVLAAVIGVVICVIAFFVTTWVLGRQGKKQSEDEITGGRQLTENPKEVAAMLKKSGKASDIQIEGLPIIKDSEIQNFCLHGTVSTGKSEFIRRLMNHARKRGDMVIVYDRSCEFIKGYYDPSIDKILNPLDSRCVNWDLWRECLTLPDFDNIANTLIPMGASEDPFWQGSGRTIFSEAAYRMRKDEDRNYEKLVDTLLSLKIDKLREYLKSTPAANLVEEKIEKTAISIRAVLTNYVKAIRYLQGIERQGEPFTIREWMRGVSENEKNGWLFISSNAKTHASLKPVISMWLSIAIRGLLEMGEDRNRRVWIFADELPTLHKIPDLVEILPEARKFGGCYVIGIQSYAQLEDIYGVKAAATLFDVLNTRGFFRSPSKQIAEFAAGEIGEKEVQKANEQYSYGADPVRDGVSVGKDMKRITLLSYSDLQILPDLTCYVTLPGPYPAVKLSLKYQKRKKIAPDFLPRKLDDEIQLRLSKVITAREEESESISVLFEKNEEVDSQVEKTEQLAPNNITPSPTKSVKKTQPVKKQSSSGDDTAAATESTVMPTGGVESELKENIDEEQLDSPPGINEQGELVDPHAYEKWQAEQEINSQQEMQRREEVNLNRSRSSADIEIGGYF
ncbi:type IV conjugative transfer system coupling protein TraD [Xenorhabdus sp. XENO-1]|uniref:type IV conjugative transfer system coupling protein TraD n=1 Tax=Xenorhabdus bovienii TaxID=40576 RepID=UPI0020CA6011|nr:type IV conjugative transfer system coupling protein TraD [Xenorhabdus bovienii]MCP9269157.1 type IV conjugative transfer system coupling protein TraD [Xenorhabdus bovienii subsp. africana]